MADQTPKGNERISFQVDAGLLFQLGEQLVARRSVALAELVKNAYDADATRVTVLLENVTKPHGTIIIEDNGTGMTFEQIQNNWMRIATDDKIKNPLSSVFNRPRTGAKGIGRFASRRLANKLILYSVAKRNDGKKEKIVVEFDWSSTFKPGQTLTEISIPYERTIVSDDEETGVLLYLDDAREVWNENDVTELEKDLFSVVTPFPQDVLKPVGVKGSGKKEPGFAIKIEVPEFPSHSGEMAEQFLSAAWGVLTGFVNKRGEPKYTLETRSTQEKLHFQPRGEKFQDLIKARFRIHYLVYKPDYFKDLALAARDAAKRGREEGGVRIYLDGFRVFPYGDPGDDWLGLDAIRARRTQRLVTPSAELELLENQISGRPWLLTPGNNQLFGAVSISRIHHPFVEINVSRERLVENKTFYDLRKFVQLGIYWMTLQYARTTAEQKPKPPSIKDVLDKARQKVTSSEEISPETRNEVLSAIDLAEERLQAQEDEFISELSMLRVMASTGVVVSMINHQLRTVIDGIRAVYVDLEEIKASIPPALQADFENVLERIGDWSEMVNNQVSQLGFLLGRPARERRRHLALRQVVEDVTKPLSLYMRDHGIKLENQVPAHLRTPPIFEAELHSLLLQIFTNALKAVRESSTREISVNAREDQDGVHILMFDTGIGLDESMWEIVFRPFETTSTPDPILGIGTGLGLWIVSEILKTYSGVARFVNADAPWKTGIEIIFPHER
jgi:signal transduction histidine kinase